MGAFMASRLLRAIGVLLFVSVFVFAIVRLIPGDPATVIAGPNSSPDLRAAITTELGLDEAFVPQYFRWMGDVLRGDLGSSLFSQLEVVDVIAARLPVSIQLAFGASLISVLWGVPLGFLAAYRRGGLLDRVIQVGVSIGLAVPAFVIATIALVVVSRAMPGWPTFGYVPIGESLTGNLRSMLLPMLSLGVPLGTTIARYGRAAMIESLDSAYMRAVRARGGDGWRMVWLHGLRNSLVPVLTIAGIQLAAVIGGSVVIEAVFSLPGLGSSLVSAILAHDYPIVQGVLLVLSGVFVLTNLLVDLAYPYIDPRISGRRKALA